VHTLKPFVFISVNVLLKLGIPQPSEMIGYWQWQELCHHIRSYRACMAPPVQQVEGELFLWVSVLSRQPMKRDSIALLP